MAKRGRPPSPDGPSEKVDLRLPVPLFDALCRAALRKDMPVRKLIRQTLQRQFLPLDKSVQPQLP